MTAAPDNSSVRFRRSVYLMLILVGTGIMLGRILAVDAVNDTALQEHLIKKGLERRRNALRDRGLSDDDPRMAKDLQREEARLGELIRLRRPFLSANDRSRWCTVRALVERDVRVAEVDEDGQGRWVPYAIDKVLEQPAWDTIDMVKHDGHLYSSKPPLMPTLMAAEYWAIYRVTELLRGVPMSLGSEPHWVGRFMLITINVIPLLIYFLLLSRLIERFGTTDWGRLFVMAAAVFGTLLTTFAVTVNNHLPAAVSCMVAVYAAVPIWFDGRRQWWYFVIAGLFAAFAAANELPALALLAALGAMLLWKAPRPTLLFFTPAALAVVMAFFAANWIAHGSLKPPYMRRQKIVREPVADDFKASVLGVLTDAFEERGDDANEQYVAAALAALGQEKLEQAVVSSGRKAVAAAVEEAIEKAANAPASEEARGVVTQAVERADVSADRPDNWYDYAYTRNGRTIDSYWRAPQGVDRGEDSPAVYAFHVLVGHHGIFSLTPIWLLSAAGTIIWLSARRGRHLRELALLIAAVTLVCLAFYLYPRQFQRNYGGVACGFRWMFWFAPLWLITMIPAADAMASRWWTRLVALLTLAASALSASYPTWNPWALPWIMDYLHYLRWIG